MSQTRLNLPTFPTPFIGRVDEIIELSQLLDDPNCRLLTLIGPGGSGKTRLAIEAARQAQPRFPDGIWFVPLASLSTIDDLAITIIKALHMQSSSQREPRLELLDYLQQRQLLLVLDNFEHLLPDVNLVAEMLHTTPHVKILVTSRERLNLTGETVFSLSGLRFSHNKPREEVLKDDAIRLFMQHARYVHPRFDLSDADVDPLLRICRLTEGMPLALVLAAGWVDLLGPEQIAEEIEQGIDILETERRDVPDRHQSMRATFTYSWRRLDDDEQAMFMKLSIFRGGFTAEAAEVIAGAQIRYLRKLVNKALVQTVSNGRYDMHELLRQFGEEKLSETGPTADIRRAHGAYYMDFLIGLKADLYSFKAAATDSVETEFENIRCAWGWAVDQRQYAILDKAADCLMSSSAGQNFRWELYEIYQSTLTVLAPAAGKTPHPVWDKIALMTEWLRDNLLLNMTDKSLVEAILARARQRGNPHQMAWGLHVLSQRYRQSGSHETAIQYGQQALQLWHDLGDYRRLTNMMVQIGACELELGHPEQAKRTFEEVVDIRRQRGSVLELRYALYHLGLVYLLHGNLSQAGKCFDDARAVTSIYGTRDEQVYRSLLDPTLLLLLRGQLTKAKANMVAYNQWIDRSGRRVDLEQGLVLDGLLATIGGDDVTLYALLDPNQTKHLDIEALAADTRSSFWYFLWFVPLMHCVLGETNRAKSSLHDLLAQGLKLKSATLQQISLPIAAVLAAREGHPERAVELLGLAHNAPQDLRGWIDHWEPLKVIRTDLEAQFAPENYRRIWQRGAQLDVERVIRELLGELGTEMHNLVEQANKSLPNPLTPKELEVLGLLAEGLTNPQIAERLFITTGTVKSHVNKILHKLDAPNRQQAVRQAQKLALL